MRTRPRTVPVSSVHTRGAKRYAASRAIARRAASAIGVLGATSVAGTGAASASVRIQAACPCEFSTTCVGSSVTAEVGRIRLATYPLSEVRAAVDLIRSVTSAGSAAGIESAARASAQP